MPPHRSPHPQHLFKLFFQYCSSVLTMSCIAIYPLDMHAWASLMSILWSFIKEEPGIVHCTWWLLNWHNSEMKRKNSTLIKNLLTGKQNAKTIKFFLSYLQMGSFKYLFWWYFLFLANCLTPIIELATI